MKKRKSLSKETRRKIGEANKISLIGHVVSLETRRKISEGHLKLKPRKAKDCSWCGKEFKVKQSHFKQRKNCSLLCYNKSKKGKFIPNSGQFKKGEHPSSATEFKSGENHPQWLGGKSFEPYGIEFSDKLKEQIRQRDSHRCQECFRHQDELYRKGKKYKLFIHHIDYNKQNNDPNNLTSLCMGCHNQTNFNRDDWTKYFEGKIV